MTYFGQFHDDPYYLTAEEEAEQSGEAWAQKQQEEAEQEWLADRAAQAEYDSWARTLDTIGHEHATHKRNDPVKVSD